MTNKEAIEILSNRLNTYYCTDEDLQAIDLAIKALEEKPKGHWIPNCHSEYINYGRHCSLCGRNVEFSENFCPKCGADMREDNNEY